MCRKINKKYLLTTVIIILVLSTVIILNSNRISEYSVVVDGAFDTTSTITAIGNAKSKKYLDECSELIKYYDEMFSVKNQNGDLYKLNMKKEAEVCDELLEVITKSKKYYEDTDGSFDITVGALSELWNDSIKSDTIPNHDNVMKYLPYIDYSSVVVNGNNIKITKDNQKFTLGAVAKGYITDKLTEVVTDNDIKGTMINLGGNIYVHGKKKNNQLWQIGIQDPKNQNDMIGTLSITDKFIITSGDYERYTEVNDKRYHHIIDAKTGYPADNGLHSVTIISDNGLEADALSTSCFLLGLEKGIDLAKKYNVEAIFVYEDEIYYSENLEEILNNRNDSYKYISY